MSDMNIGMYTRPFVSVRQPKYVIYASQVTAPLPFHDISSERN